MKIELESAPKPRKPVIVQYRNPIGMAIRLAFNQAAIAQKILATLNKDGYHAEIIYAG